MDPELSDKLREEGNEFYKDQMYYPAIVKYEEAFNYNPYDYRVLSNKAAALFYLKEYSRAEEAARRSYLLNKNNVKGFYRAAEAAIERNRTKEALKYILVGIDFNKDNVDLQNLHKRLDPHCKNGDFDFGELLEAVKVEKQKVLEEHQRLQRKWSVPSSETNGRLDEEEPGKETNNKTPKKNAVSSIKKQPARKDPEKVKKEALKAVYKYAAEGSRLYLDGAAKLASDNFRNAITGICKQLHHLKVPGTDVLLLDSIRYSYAIACIDTPQAKYIAYGITSLELMTESAGKRYPFVYLTLGKGYVNLNLFKLATKPLRKGLDLIDLKPQKYCAWYWPGYPKKPIEETTPSANLKEKLTHFLEICKNPPTPDGLCRYPLCDFEYPYTDSKLEIYFSDPDFKGFYDIGCSEKCRIQYHLTCWKNFKNTMDKKTDKALCGMKCVTPDCDGTINEVKMVEADGSEVVIGNMNIEEPPGKQKRTCKLEKKAEQKLKRKVRRDDRDTVSLPPKEVVTQESRVNPDENDNDSKDLKTIVRKLKKERKNTVEGEEEAGAKSSHRPKAVPLPIDIDDSKIKVLKKNEDEEVQPVKTKKTKEPKKKKSDKCYIIMDDVLGTPEDSQVVEKSFDHFKATLSKGQDSVYGSSPFTKIFPEQISGWSDVENASFVDTPAADSLITFFMQFVQSNGPLETDGGMLLDIVQQLPTDSQEIVANVGGLRAFLLTNRQFVSVDELVCCLSDISKAGELIFSTCRKNLKFPVSASQTNEAQEYPSLEEVNPIEDKWQSEEEEEWEGYDDDDDEDEEDWHDEYDSQRTETPIDNTYKMCVAVANECKQNMSTDQYRRSESIRSDNTCGRTMEAVVQTEMSSSDIEGKDRMIDSLFEKVRVHEETIKRQMDTKTKFQNQTVAEITELKKKLQEANDKIKESEIAKREVYSNWEAEKKKLLADRKKGIDEMKKAMEDKKNSIREKEAAEAEAEKQKNQKEKSEQNLITLTVQNDQLSERAGLAESNIKTLQATLDNEKKRFQAFQIKYLDNLWNIWTEQVESVKRNCHDNLTCLKKAETLVNAGSSPSEAEIHDATQQWFDAYGKVKHVNDHFQSQINIRKQLLSDGKDVSGMSDLSLPVFNVTAPTLINPMFPVENQIQVHPASSALSQLLKQLPQQSGPTNGLPNLFQQCPFPNTSLPAFLTPPNLAVPSTSAGLSNLLSPPSEKPSTADNATTEHPKTAPNFVPPIAHDMNLQKSTENTQKPTEQKTELPAAAVMVDSDSCSSRSSTPSLGNRGPLSNLSEETKLFVGKIPLQYKEGDIANLFSKFVPVVDVSLRLSGHAYNFAFVTLESVSDRDLLLSLKPFCLDDRHVLNLEAKLPKDQQMTTSYVGDKAGPGGPRLRFEHKKEDMQHDQDKSFFVHPASKVVPKQQPAAVKPHASSPVETAAMDAIKSQSSVKIEEIILNMQKRMPTHTRQEIIALLIQFRESRPGRTINGLTEDFIFHELRKLANKSRMVGASSVGMAGLENFSAPLVAWGGKGTKTEENNFKDRDNDCAICYDKILRKKETPLSCGHRFHYECVERWVREQGTCPKCRKHVLLPHDFPSLQSQ